jgi:hypothetical protein
VERVRLEPVRGAQADGEQHQRDDKAHQRDDLKMNIIFMEAHFCLVFLLFSHFYTEKRDLLRNSPFLIEY